MKDKDPTIRRVLVIFGLVTVVLIAVVVHAIRNLRHAVAASDWVNHTHALINELEGIAASTQAAEGSLRVFVVTKDARDLATARQSHVRLADHLEVAGALTRDSTPIQPQVERLATLAGQRITFGRELAARPDDATRLLAADAGGTAVDEILRLTERLVTEQMALLAERDKAAWVQAEATRWTIWIGVAVKCILLGLGAWLVVSDISARRRAHAALAEANAQLETKVQARTAELTEANARLQLENLERRWGNQALEHQLRYNNLIINSIGDLVLVITKAGNVSRINPAVEAITGWAAKDLVGHPLTQVTRFTAPPPGFDDPLTQALRQGRDLREQAALIRNRHGEENPVRLTFFPLRDGNNVVGGIIVLQSSGQPFAPA